MYVIVTSRLANISEKKNQISFLHKIFMKKKFPQQELLCNFRLHLQHSWRYQLSISLDYDRIKQ